MKHIHASYQLHILELRLKFNHFLNSWTQFTASHYHSHWYRGTQNPYLLKCNFAGKRKQGQLLEVVFAISIRRVMLGISLSMDHCEPNAANNGRDVGLNCFWQSITMLHASEILRSKYKRKNTSLFIY